MIIRSSMMMMRLLCSLLLIAIFVHSALCSLKKRDLFFAINVNDRTLGLTMTSRVQQVLFSQTVFAVYEPMVDAGEGKEERFVAGQKCRNDTVTKPNEILVVSNIGNNSLKAPLKMKNIFPMNMIILMREFSFYQMDCPPHYHSLGDVAMYHTNADGVTKYRCVHEDFLIEAKIGPLLWDGSVDDYHMKGVYIWQIVPKDIANYSRNLNFFIVNNKPEKPQRKVYTLMTIKGIKQIHGRLEGPFTAPPNDIKNPIVSSVVTSTTTPVTPCNRYPNTCHINTECINLDKGRFKCVCKTGYIWTAGDCIEVHEELKKVVDNIDKVNESGTDDEFKQKLSENLQHIEHDIVMAFANVETETKYESDVIKLSATPVKISKDEIKVAIPSNLSDHLDVYSLNSLTKTSTESSSGVLSFAEISVETNCVDMFSAESYKIVQQNGKIFCQRNRGNAKTKHVDVKKKRYSTLLTGNKLMSINFKSHNRDLRHSIGVEFSANIAGDATLQKLAIQALQKQEKYTSFGLIGHDITRITSLNRECVFLNYTTNQWSDAGCRANFDANVGMMTCTCEHMTMFAVLLSMETVSIPYSLKICTAVAELLSIACLIATLIVLIWLRKNLHSDRTYVQINLSVSLLMLHVANLMNNSTVTGIHDSLCAFMAVITHYFLVSSAFWMLTEAILLYSKTAMHHGFGSSSSSHFIGTNKLLVSLAWGIPALIVGICAAVGFMNEFYLDYSLLYINTIGNQSAAVKHNNEVNLNNLTSPAGLYLKDKENDISIVDIHHHQAHVHKDIHRIATDGFNHRYDQCWLSKGKMVLWGAIVPLAVIFIVNALILTRIAVLVWKLSKETELMRPSDYRSHSNPNNISFYTKEASQQDLSTWSPKKSQPWGRKYSVEHITVTVRALLLLFPILGIPWLCAFLVNIEGPAQTVFMWLNAILNGSQGVFVLILYCLVRKDVRGIMSRKRRNHRLH